MDNPISRIEFISVADSIFTKELKIYGYKFVPDPKIYDEPTNIWYVNHNKADNMNRIIDIHTVGYDIDVVYEMAVNLCRWTTLWGTNDKTHYPRQFNFVRLAPFIWDNEGSSDQWWHFRDKEELEKNCLDALEKIINYGIPFLSDPDSKSPY